MNREQAKVFFEQNNIRYVLAQFVDIPLPRRRPCRSSTLDMVLTDGAAFGALRCGVSGWSPEGPDYMAVGELATLQNIPWMPG